MAKQDDYDYGPRAGLLAGFNGWHLLVAILLAGLGLGLFALLQFQGLQTPAVMEQATIARRLAAGEGFTAQVIRPFDLWLLDVPAAELPTSIPVLWQAPLYPHVLSWTLRLVRPAYRFTARGILDAEVRAIVPLGIVLLLLCAMVTFLLAHALFGEKGAGLAALVFLVSPLSLRLLLEGGALPLAMLLATASVLLAWWAIAYSFHETHLWRPPLYAAIAGVLAGLLFVTAYAGIWIGMGVGIFLCLNVQRWRWAVVAIFVGAFLVVILPWGTGSPSAGWWGVSAYPYAALLETRLFPGDTFLRETNPVLRNWQVVQAMREGLATRYEALFRGDMLRSAGIVMVFFLVSLFCREERHWQQHSKWIAAGLLLLLPLFPPVLGCPHGSWVALYPILTIFGVQTLLRILDREDYFDVSVRPALLGVFLGLCLLPSVMDVVRRDATSPYPPYHGPLQAYAAQWIDGEEILISDIPWSTAWYGQQPSLLWPESVADVRLYESIAGGIYLAGRQARAFTADVAWHPMRLMGIVPEDFPFRMGLFLPTGEREQILLIRESGGRASPDDGDGSALHATERNGL